MLSRKASSTFAKALDYFEFRAQNDLLLLVQKEIEDVAEKATSHACLRCSHACLTVEVLSSPESKKAWVAQRGCDRYVRLELQSDARQDFSLELLYFACSWEERDHEKEVSDV
jgi:hypothetical protein